MKSGKTLKLAALWGAAALLLLVAAGRVAATEGSGRDDRTSGETGASSSPASVSGSSEVFFDRLWTPQRKSVAVAVASSYDPNFNISSLLGTAAAVYDHGYLWDGVRSGNTAFKLEASAGSMVRPDIHLIASVNMLSMYYPGNSAGKGLRPYVEAGIGGIYTDYRVSGQAYRFLFNPLLGIGAESGGEGQNSFFVAMRLHHISNGSIHRDNRGVNSLLLQVGRYF